MTSVNITVEVSAPQSLSDRLSKYEVMRRASGTVRVIESNVKGNVKWSGVPEMILGLRAFAAEAEVLMERGEVSGIAQVWQIDGKRVESNEPAPWREYMKGDKIRITMDSRELGYYEVSSIGENGELDLLPLEIPPTMPLTSDWTQVNEDCDPIGDIYRAGIHGIENFGGDPTEMKRKLADHETERLRRKRLIKLKVVTHTPTDLVDEVMWPVVPEVGTQWDMGDGRVRKVVQISHNPTDGEIVVQCETYV